MQLETMTKTNAVHEPSTLMKGKRNSVLCEGGDYTLNSIQPVLLTTKYVSIQK